MYFVNRPELGEFKANGRRNVLLGITLVFALGLVVNGLAGLLR